MKKRLFLMSCLALSLSFSACSKDDDDNDYDPEIEQDDQDNDDEELSPEDIANQQAIEKLFSGLCYMGDTPESMFKFFEKLPAGKYTTVEEDDADVRVFVKTADNGVMLLNPNSLKEKSNMVGNTAWGPNYLIGPDQVGYEYHNDMYSNGTFGPSLHSYKFTSKEDFEKTALRDDNPINRVSRFVSGLFGCLSIPSASELKDHKMISEKTTCGGIECTHYSFIPKDKFYAELLGSVADLWVTDNGCVLKAGIYGNTSQNFVYQTIEDKTFEKAFNSMMGTYNYHGAFNLSDCILSYKIYKAVMPKDVCPESVRKHFVRYEGEVKNYDVSYRAWKTLNGFTGISFVVENISIEDARAYIKRVKDLELCTVNDDFDIDGMILYQASNWDCTDPALGETERYPAYKILYSESSQVLTVEFTEDAVSGV